MIAATETGPFLTILVQLSVFATGACAVAVGLLAWRRPKRWLWYAFVKLGTLLTLGTVLWTILLPLQQLPITGPGIAYGVGLALTSIGLVGVSSDIARKLGRDTGVVGASILGQERKEES